jgi:hypothetical protein
VERYRKLRAAATALNHRIIDTIPRRTIGEVADAIGISHNGVLVLDTEDVSSVLMDCCLYDWYENGKNVVERYAETHPEPPGTDEGFLLSAYLQAKYRILVVRSTVRGAGLHCHDVLNREELFLMDIALSQTASRDVALATRTIPLGGYSMTGGAGLPVASREASLRVLERLEMETPKALCEPGGLALSIVRVCLAAGASHHVRYETPGSRVSRPRKKPGRRR